MNRPRLVFAHYFGGSSRSWAALVDAIGGDIDCIVPDLPGFGGTPAPRDLSLNGYADAFSTIAGDTPFVAVGHSMGGKIALALAARRPVGLTGLILLAASPPTPEPMSDADRQANLDAFGNRLIARKNLGSIGSRLSPQALSIVVDDELRVAEPAWRWWLEHGSRDDISAATRCITLRTLVVSGDDDQVMGEATAPAIARGLTGATLRIVPDAGHLLPLERPQATAALIRDFIEV
ncbi:alpha/beta hydrolase [Sphingosinicellaceae bacterium]|nr:alpha/beta hydrolase [Sphingosinicellaceae bacterium]